MDFFYLTIEPNFFTMNLTACPNCGATIKSGAFSKVELLHSMVTEMVNHFSDKDKEAYCTKCPSDLFRAVEEQFNVSKLKLKEEIDSLIKYVPIVTIYDPTKWDYTVVEMVTAQYVVGTGVVSEIGSGITDLFGMRSDIYATKLKNGEEFCKNILRYNTLLLGCNAIIGTDVNYSEAGGLKGMLMVCMSGTAVKLNNPEITTYANEINKVVELIKELENIRRFDAVRFN